MQTISVSCEGTSIMGVVRQIKFMFWSHRRPSGRKEFGDGPVKAYIYLLLTCRKTNFSYASIERIANEHGVDARTVRRWLKMLRENGFISSGRKFVSGCWRQGHYLNAHKWIVDLLKTIRGVVVKLHGNSEKDAEQSIQAAVLQANTAGQQGQVGDKLSPQLTIRNGESMTPPYPPQGEAADAGEERENESKIEPHVASPENQYPANKRSRCRSDKGSGLRIHKRTANKATAGRLHSESVLLRQTADTVLAEEKNLTASAWQAALAILLQKLPEQEVNLWLRPISASQTPAGLRLDYPDRYSMAWVQEHFGSDIRSALQQVGITEFYFSFGEQEKALQKEKNREMRVETARQVERQAQALRSMPLQEQFAALLNAYPRKTSGEWFAWQTFKRLARKGELPEISELLQMIEAKRQSDDWNRDAGRWIPGLSKWLNNRPWWKIDCKERGKEPGEAVSW